MIEKFFRFVGYFFFFLMLIIPTTYQGARGGLLAVLLFVPIYKTIIGEWKINRSVLIIGIVCAVTSLALMFYGLTNGAPGAIAVGTVYVLWPLIFLFLMGSTKSPAIFNNYIKTIVAGIICASLMGILMVAEGAGFISTGLSSFFEGQGAGLGIYSGTVEYSLYNMTTIIFGFPFLLSLIMLPGNFRKLNSFWKLLVIAATFLSIITLFISGRRAFWVIAAICPVIIFIIFKMAKIKGVFDFKKTLFIGASVLAISSVTFSTLEIKPDKLFDDIMTGFDFSGSSTESSYLRAEQFRALMNGWADHPLFGHGHGSFTKESIRSDETPWAYELAYFALLYQTGIFGISVYSMALLWTFTKCISISRNNQEAASVLLPMLVGLTSFLIANATNPYLAKFDYLWTIFLTVAMLNSFLTKRRSDGHYHC